jgi:hypothetical protein
MAFQRDRHLMRKLQQTRTVERRLRWWRGLACGLVVLVLLTWTLPSGPAQEEATGSRGKICTAGCWCFCAALLV